MTPEQLIKQQILIVVDRWQERNGLASILAMTGEQIDEAYEEAEYGEDEDYIQDAAGELREGQVETDVECDYSRHYESSSVAMKCGEHWVGWTYWYGGGKHGEPGAIEWMNRAYFLDCVEEEKVMIVRSFTKK